MVIVEPLVEVGRMKVQICPSSLTYPKKRLLATKTHPILAMMAPKDLASHQDHLVPYPQ